VIKRIAVRYRLRVDPEADRSTIDRVHGFHASRCPVAKTIGACVEITTDLELVEA
jgi:uncharacterized OsmC-like protein